MIGLVTRSAPWISLGSTLPVSCVEASVAIDGLLSSTARGTSSAMVTSRLPLVTSPSVSLADTGMLSPEALPAVVRV